MNLSTQPSPNADDDWDAKATEALEAARLMPARKDKSEAPETCRLVAQGSRHAQTIPGEEARQAAQEEMTSEKPIAALKHRNGGHIFECSLMHGADNPSARL